APACPHPRRDLGGARLAGRGLAGRHFPRLLRGRPIRGRRIRGRGGLLFDLLCHFGLPPQFTSVRDSASHEVLLSVRLLLLGGRADHPCRGLLGTEWTWARVHVTGQPRHRPANWGEDAAATSSPLKVPRRMDVMRTQRVSALPAP